MVSRAQVALRRQQAEAALNLLRIHREMERGIQALLEKEKLSNITPAQANALTILFQEKCAMTARQLARQMNLSEVTVGRFVRALENAGWVVRELNPEDTRAILVRPSRKAYRAFPRFLKVTNRLLDNSFAGFSEAEIATLVGLVDRVRDNVVLDR